MSKWIFSPKNKTFWNLDKVEKIRLEETHILLIYNEDGEQHVEFETQGDLMIAWNELWHRLSDGK